MILEKALDKSYNSSYLSPDTLPNKDVLNGKTIQQVQTEFAEIIRSSDITALTNYKSLFDSTDIKNFLTDAYSSEANLSALSGVVNNLNKNLAETGTTASKTGNLMRSAFSLIGGALTGTLITSAIDLGINFITEQLQRTQKLVDAAKAACQEWEQKDSSLQDQKQQYTQLKTLLDSGSLSEQETISVKQQILDLQNQIVASYGEQAKGIDLVNGGLESQIDLLNRLSMDEANKLLNENRTGMQKAVDEMTEIREYTLGSTGMLTNGSGKKIEEIARKYETEGIELVSFLADDSAYNIRFTGDATQAQEVLNSFATDVRNLQNELGGDNRIIENILESAERSLQDNKSILTEYQNTYQQYLTADLFSKGTGDNDPAGVLNRFTTAVRDYNAAVFSGDSSAITAASENFKQVSGDVEKVIAEFPQYKEMFDEIGNSLDSSAAKVANFNKQISGENTSKHGKYMKGVADSLKEQNLFKSDVIKALETSGMQRGEAEIRDLADEWGLTADSSLEDIQNFVSALLHAGLIADETADKVNKIFEIPDTSEFGQYKKALNTSNPGGQYLEMAGGLEKVKNLSAQGLTGTDDYQTYARMISPTGSTDKKNFDENVEKMKRYFTPDSRQGVDSFLGDLEARGLAEMTETIGENGEAIQEWKLNFTDLEEASRKMGMGFEPFLAMFGRAKDYGISSNVITSLEQGTEQLADLHSQLAFEEENLNSLTASGSNKTIDANGNIHMTAGTQDEIDAARERVNLLKADLTETLGYMDQLTSRSTEDYNAQVDAAKDTIQSLADQREQVLNEGGENAESIVAMIEDQIAEIADEYHIELDAHLNINPEGSGLDTDGEEAPYNGFEIDSTTASENLEELTEKAELANEKFKELHDDGSSINLNPGTAAEAEDSLAKTMEFYQSLRDETGGLQPEVDLTDVENAQAALQICVEKVHELNAPSVMSIDSSSLDDGVGSAVVALQNFQAAYDTLQSQKELSSLGVSVDTSAAEAALTEAYDVLQTQNPEILKTLTIDMTSLETIEGSIRSFSPELVIRVNQGALDTFQGEDLSKTDTIKYNPDYLNVYTTDPPHQTSTVDMYPVYHYNSTPPIDTPIAGFGIFGAGSEADGNVHIARSTGSLGESRNVHALTGELGPELVVRGSRYFTVGDYGPEIVHLKQGDIVFNHRQTHDILTKGYASGRGRALAAGNAFVSGTALADGNSDSSKKADTTIDWIERLTKSLERMFDALKSYAEDLYQTYQNQNAAIDTALAKGNKDVKTFRDASVYYTKKASAVGIDNSLQKKIREGQLYIEDIEDEDLREKIKEFQDLYEKAQDCSDKARDLQLELIELNKSKLDNIEDDFDSLISYQEKLISNQKSFIDLQEAKGGSASVSDYDGMIDAQNQIISYLNGKRQELQNQFDSLTSSGVLVENTDDWWEWKGNIESIQKELNSARSDIEDLNDSIRDIRWQGFNDGIDKLDDLNDELDFLSDKIEDSALFSENGKLTSAGSTKIALLSMQMVNARTKVADYDMAIKALDRELANGVISQSQYNEELGKYKEQQRKASNELSKYKKAVIDVVKEGIDKQTDAMEKYIKAQKEAISQEERYEDYLERVNETQKQINSIRAQLASMSGDDSGSAKAKRQYLNDELLKLEDKLAKDQKDHKTDMLKEAYDEELDALKEKADKEKELLDTDLAAQSEAIAGMLAGAQDNYAAVYEELGSMAEAYGIHLSSELSDPWKNAVTAIETYKKAAAAASQTAAGQSAVGSNVADINTNAQKQATNNSASVPPAKETAAAKAGGQWKKNNTGWWYEHDGGSYTKNGWEQIDGKWYHFDGKGYMQKGWVKDGQTWYYLNPGGDMAVNKWIKATNGKDWYYLGSDGKMVENGMINSNGKDYYLAAGGKMKTGWFKLGATWYYANASGAVQKNQWIKGANGKDWYYVGPDGIMYSNMNAVIDGKNSRFDGNGRWLGYFARGARDISSLTGYGVIGEGGRDELVATKGGQLVRLDDAKMIFSNEQTKRLWELSQLSAPLSLSAAASSLPAAALPSQKAVSISQNFGSLITVEGNVTKDALPELEKIMDQKLKSFEKNMYQGLQSLTGLKR